MAHNGEPLAPTIVDALALANGGALDPSWFSDDDRTPADEVVDWVESIANAEDAALR